MDSARIRHRWGFPNRAVSRGELRGLGPASPPPEEPERQGKADRQPPPNDGQFGEQPARSDPLKHRGPESVNHRGQRENLDQGLYRVGKP